MAKLNFSLVSPERALFSGDVDQVVVPGADGQFGALANHAPMMSVIKAGTLRVIDGSNERKLYIGGGMAEISPDGLTILAEDAVDLAEIDRDGLTKQLADAKEDAKDSKDEAARAKAAASVARLEAILAA